MLQRARLRPVVPTIAALALAAIAGVGAVGALLTTGCGKPVPRYQLHTAPEWVSMLWDPDVRVRTAALTAISQFGTTAPDAVLAALEEAIQTPPATATASPFSMAVDLSAGNRLGLPATPVSEAVAAAAGVLRGRAMAAGATPMSIKTLLDGTIDIVVSRPMPREAVERLQTVLATRGAMEIRLLAPDPAESPVRVSGDRRRARVYDDPMPYADRLAAEAKEVVSARQAKRPPVPSDPRWRAVPKTDAAEAPSDFVLVEEPATDADSLDERMVVVARAARDADGRASLRIEVKPERREALARFSAANEGHTMAVVLDGVLLGLQRIPKTDGDALVLSLWPQGSPGARGAPVSAEDLAVVLAAGRLPWPLRPIPLDASFGADPAPDNLIAKAFTLLEERAVPTLERIAAKAPYAWSRKSATWALDQIRARSDAPGR